VQSYYPDLCSLADLHDRHANAKFKDRVPEPRHELKRYCQILNHGLPGETRSETSGAGQRSMEHSKYWKSGVAKGRQPTRTQMEPRRPTAPVVGDGAGVGHARRSGVLGNTIVNIAP
jgi:hypothetical protein